MSDVTRLTPQSLLAHEAFVLRLARSLVRDEAAALDLAQETWLSALENPPRPGAVRAWLARVTRNHALNAARGRGRRAEREHLAARPEAVEDGAGASERLELEHAVVRAVLELDEPFRSAVIAVHHDGVTPSELARARGVPAGTVRSWLSRGLERLRERLDREHGGDRRAWALALAGLARRRAALVSAGAGATGVATWLAAGLVAVAGIVVWRALALAPAADTPASVASAGADAQSVALALGASEPARVAVPAAVERPSASAAPADGVARTGVTEEAEALAARALWIKDRALARRTSVDAGLAGALSWTDGRTDAGVVRLVDRRVFGDRLDLPWLAGGASTWSFTERTHDALRHAQLRLEQQGLGGPTGGGAKGVVIDLGEADLRGLALDPRAALAALDERARAAWEVAARPLTVEPDMDRLALQRALRELGHDDEVEPEEGHVYLVRAFRPLAFDVVALIEPLRVDEQGCTLAWALLEARPVPGAQPAPMARDDERTSLAPQPDLEPLDEAALLRELQAVEARLAALVAAGPDAGRTVHTARVLDARSTLARSHAEDAQPWLFSFATGRHGRRSEPDLELSDGTYSMDFNARSISWILDLGAIALDDAESVAAVGFGSRWDLMSGATLPHFVPQAERAAAQVELQRRAAEAGLANRAAAHVGHVYLVRSIYPTWHDQLVAFRVDERSELGDRLSWRVLSTWPVDRR